MRFFTQVAFLSVLIAVVASSGSTSTGSTSTKTTLTAASLLATSQASKPSAEPTAQPLSEAQAAHLAALKKQDAALVVGLRGQILRCAMPPSKYLQGRRITAWVYLPPDYKSSTRRYPVAYLLHGAPGSVRDPFVNAGVHRVAERLILARQIEPLILVGWDGYGPRGFEDATYFLDRKDGSYQMESFVTRELVPFIDRTFRTQARSQSRALVGFSAGGYGAANLGFKHPELFGLMASHAGFFDPNDDARTMTQILGPRAANAALWNANSPLLRAREVPSGKRLHFYMDCGRDDPLLSEWKKMQAELKARHADFEAQIVEGAHDWTFLSRHYADSLRFCDERFREMAKQKQCVPQATNTRLQPLYLHQPARHSSTLPSLSRQILHRRLSSDWSGHLRAR